MKIGQSISFYRKKKMLTQQELADKVGVSRVSVAMWESGMSQPTLKNIELVAQALEIDIKHLF